MTLYRKNIPIMSDDEYRVPDEYRLPSSSSEDEEFDTEPLKLDYGPEAAAKWRNENPSTPVQKDKAPKDKAPKKNKRKVYTLSLAAASTVLPSEKKMRTLSVKQQKKMDKDKANKEKTDADFELAPHRQNLGKLQMKKLREILLTHNINSSHFGWGYGGKATGWTSMSSPEMTLHQTYPNIYFMCGVTDRLMRFYAEHQNFIPCRFAYKHEGNDWRLTSGTVEKPIVADYCFAPSIRKFLQENKQDIDALHQKLGLFLKQEYVDPFVRRLGFLFACGVATLRVCANARIQHTGNEIASKIKSALTRLLNICHYDTDLQDCIGILVDQLPQFPILDWQDDENLQMVQESSAGKKVDTDLHVHLFTKLRF